MNWRVSPWWKSQGEPGEKQTLGGDTRDRQGAVLLAELIRRRPEGTLGSPVSACPSWLPHRQPSSSRQPSTSSPWSRKRLDYCSRTPSSSGSSRYCPRDGTGGVGQSWLTRAGKSLQFLGLGVEPSTLLSQRVKIFPFPWQGGEPPFNLASLTWQGEKGWGPVFQYFHPFGVSGMAWWQFWRWGGLVELPCENQVGTRLWG